MNDFLLAIGVITAGFAAIVAISLLSAIPVFYAWNVTVPVIFGLPSITFTQAVWLSILFSCLFKPSVPSKSDIKSAIKEALKSQ